jgi:hypothetical protein
MRDDNAGAECAQIQFSRIDHVIEHRIGRVQQLKAAITTESVQQIGTHSATDSIRRFEDLDGDTCPVETLRAGQPGEPCAHDDHRARRHWACHRTSLTSPACNGGISVENDA